METCRFGQTALNSPPEQLKVLVIFRIETLFSDEFPQAFNQIEIGRVGRQKENFDPQSGSLGLHEPTALIPRIVHHHGDGYLQAELSDLLE